MRKRIFMSALAFIGGIGVGVTSAYGQHNHAPSPPPAHAEMQPSPHAGHTAHGGAVAKHPQAVIMDEMMIAMDKVQVKCCMDMNFLAQMMAHHQGAVEMAKYEIEHGKNHQMVQMARSILAEQQVEIMKMQLLLNHFATKDSMVAPTPDYFQAMAGTMEKMMKDSPASVPPDADADVAFAQLMIPHHQAAIDMALVILQLNADQQVCNLALKIIADQQEEINIMKDFLQQQTKQ